MIDQFRSHIKIPFLSDVKKVEHHCDASPMIKLEWCGMQCSGKYGQLLKYNQGTGRLENPDHSAGNQGK